MIKLKDLLFEKKNKKTKRSPKKRGKEDEKFIGQGDQFKLVKGIKQAQQKVNVINKATGKNYEVTKGYYDKNRSKYTLYAKQKKTTKPKPEPLSKKFVGGGDEFKSKEVTTAKQFIEKYMGNNKPPSSQLITYNQRMMESNSDWGLAVYSYTSTLYQTLNKALRRGWKLEGHEIESMRNISQALAACDKYDGVVQRFINIEPLEAEEFNETYAKGNIVQAVQFISTTHDTEKKVYTIGLLDPDNLIYRLFIKSKTGAPIEGISLYAYQKQILFDVGTKFKVVDVIQNKSEVKFENFTAIYMEEV